MTDEIPQLRVRTEFSFRQTFGPIGRVAAALAEMKAPAAGIVDGGTWGHVRWAKAAATHGFKPLFGTELTLPRDNGMKPTAWALAEDTRKFYRFSSTARRNGVDLDALFAETKSGIIRFAGTALTDPEAFDYIDINPATPLAQRAALALHRRTGKPLVVTSDNCYPRKQDYPLFMAIANRERVTPQHLLTRAELRRALPLLSDAEFEAGVRGAFEVAERCASELQRAPMIHFDGDLRALTEEGRKTRLALGHIAEWTDEYEARLQRELDLIEKKDYESYFLVVADLIAWSKKHMLVGPGRGSSAGSLVCYLLRITEIDPLVHGLLFERFISIVRPDLPDIDIDFNDQKRDMIFEYLADKYGKDCVARIGNVSTLKPKSAVAEVCKRFGIPDNERFDLLNVLIEYSSGDSRYGKGLEDTLTLTEVGKRFSQRHPSAAIMGDVEGHAWHTGIHAAGVIVCNEPVCDFCTVTDEGVAQIDKPDSEKLNLLKIDALGLRTLGVIEDAGCVTADQLYGLKLDDPEVFRVFNERRYAAIFQFEGQAQRTVSAQITVNDFQALDHITALARPGPLGGGATNHYINRANGREEVEYEHETMAAYLGDTRGVVLYQEQVMRICGEIGNFDWPAIHEIQKSMSGRKGKEYFDRRGGEFVAGAVANGMTAEGGQALWDALCSFGAWAMNKSHTVAYSVISYWCAWMKRYYPIEYAAACLRGAKDDDQTVAVLREMQAEGIHYIPFDPDLSEVNWSVKDGKLVGGFCNLVGIGPAKAAAAIEARNAGKLNREKFLALPVKFADLYPVRNRWRAIYEDPEAHGCRAGSRVLTAPEFPDEGDVLYIGRLAKKEMRDENETVRLARRGGRRVEGQTLFADLVLKDDTGSPIICRIDRKLFEPLGRLAVERLQVDQDDLMVRGKRIRNYNMIKVARLRCLNRPEALNEES